MSLDHHVVSAIRAVSSDVQGVFTVPNQDRSLLADSLQRFSFSSVQLLYCRSWF